MQHASVPVRILALVAALILFTAAGGGAFAVADDYLARDVLPEGSRIAELDVAGMTLDEARTVAAERIAEPLAAPIEVTYGDRTFTLDAASLVSVDVDAMVAEAFSPQKSSALVSRVADRTLGRPAGGAASVDVSIDEAALDLWVASVAEVVDSAPVEATMTVDGDRLVLVPSRAGETVDQTATRQSLLGALRDGSRQIALQINLTQPTVSESGLGPAILVDISERHLLLYERGELAKEYGVAVGTPSHPTPRGDFVITLKRYMPTWSNPGSAWAADMPRTIAPGPSNPLGTRALNLDAPGIRIHGTSADYSIGTAASHGCIRMHRWDVEELYERVEVGTPVYIVR